MYPKFTSHSGSGILVHVNPPSCSATQDPWANPATSCLCLLHVVLSVLPHPALRKVQRPCAAGHDHLVIQRIRKACRAWWMLLSPWFNQTLYAGADIWAKMNPTKTNTLVLAKLDLLIFPAWLHNLRWKKVVIALAFPFSTLHCRLVTHLFILTIHLSPVSSSSISFSSKKI